MAATNQKRRKKRGSGVWARLLTMLAVVAAVVFCIAIFFKVDQFDVTGNERYSADEIVAASGLEQGGNLLMFSRSEVAAQIQAKLPYITEVRVHRALPDTVTIEVVECSPVAVISDAYGAQWLMSSDGRLLEQAETATAAQYPQVTGAIAVEPQAGQSLVTEDSSTTYALCTLLEALDGSSVQDKIVSVDVEKIYALTMMYGEQYEIDLGGTDDLDYKFAYLEQILEELKKQNPDASGQIDLTLETDKVARFLQW
jgi:cell division protein FtsQ